MKAIRAALKGLVVAALVTAATAASAQNEQFIPMNGYWVGPYAPGGSGIFGGFIDYINMVNARDGGVGGVKLTNEKCETEYNNARGVECYERSKKKGPTGASVIHPLSTGITYSLIDKATEDKIPIISLGYGRTDATDGRVVMAKHIEDPVPTPESPGGPLPEALERAVMRSLAKHPDQRHQSAAELARDLAQAGVTMTRPGWRKWLAL